MAPVQAQTAAETVLHNFGSPPKGANPSAGVIRDSAGNLYGTTPVGGAANAGVVFKVNTAGRETVLYSFTGGADGSQPYAGVIADSSGNLYGTTYSGGQAGWGVVFKVDKAGQETVLYSFKGGADGGNPMAGVIRDPAGNLYGTTCYGGGTANAGTVYKLDTAGQETVLHSFTGQDGDGADPYAGVIRDSAGNLYGTTNEAGGGLGMVYKLDTAGQETVLYSFTGGADEGYPLAGVIRDSAGNLYGIAGGDGTVGPGVVYKLNTAGQLTVLLTFSYGGASGPKGPLIRDSAGNLYGTTGGGGGTSRAGMVYKLDPTGQETVLYSFKGGADGGNPMAGVIRDSAGNLYGTASGGGTGGFGVAFKLSSAGQETVLYSFPGPADGMHPFAGVIRDSAGNLYGTTNQGGAEDFGVVYKLNSAAQETVLYTFTGGPDGGYPWAGVIRDSAGNLYGPTSSGGTANGGVVYELDTSGQETVLYSFPPDGGWPISGVIRDPAGNLYGAAGGDPGFVYKLGTTGQFTVLYNFTGGADGGDPQGGVIRDSAGNLYGTASGGGASGAGVVFKVNTGGQERVLYSFTGGADGGYPQGGVIADSAGNLYGTTSAGGITTGACRAEGGCGVVFKLDKAGQETVLYSFTSYAAPSGGVIRDAAGNLYGTTYYGGAANAGMVYKLDTAGQETALYSFTGGADGGNPPAGVIADPAGNLYGTTCYGGKEGTGVVFKVITQ